ncbi:cutinase family protein [Mycobacterium manitobense]|uniref:Cutinase family protein n=1 Tax=[Mycobacterium] manitobense TaxID=190147 RepID=A0A9X2YMU5_9MYCO|nr:cutinase family protein [[Mycobacterium] manitobense]MCV7170649.1 cutinase family protein [[Mycobacterium] manitobense]
MTLDKLRIIGSALAPAALFALITTVAPDAVAAPCPDVEVVFARGTTEPPGVGGTGGAFVEALRSQLGSRSLGVYAVNYPASNDFDSSTPAGARDAAGRIQATAANCPNTRMVLGGYSQGAAVIDMATGQLPPEVADHVAAVADFGGPRSTFADSLSPGPSPVIAPAYAGKLIDLCVPNDPICFQGGWDMGAHAAYVRNGLVNQAAAFAAGRV